MVSDSYRCPGCELKEMEAEAVHEAKGTKGVHVYIRPNPDADLGDRLKVAMIR